MKGLLRIGVGLSIAVTLGFVPSAFSQKPQGSVTAAQVQASIEAGVRFLKQRQIKGNGTWEGYPNYGCGQTALVTLALLNCGVAVDDPIIVKSLQHLRSIPSKKTYECALQTMVFCMANPKQDSNLVQENIRWLAAAQRPQGGWGYGQDDAPSYTDPSNSQFALLALWEAQRVGFQVPMQTLKQSYVYWRSKQLQNGSWQYSNGVDEGGTGSMTSAGIASLLISEDALDIHGDALLKEETIRCCQGKSELTAVERGTEWLGQHFTIDTNPSSVGFWSYYLYGLERVGRLTGLRFFGGHDWYREGCDKLVRQQDPVQGFFPDGNEDRITSTALSLLFLSKGKRQIVLGRLDYRHPGETSNDWAIHRRAIQNLTGHIEKAWKRDLAWQTLELNKANAKGVQGLVDALECPVLFISGRGPLNLTPNEKGLLKHYVDKGGFIFAEACQGEGCDHRGFEQSFRALIEELFEKQLLKLPPSHPLWSTEALVEPSAFPEGFWLYGMEQCCRTSVVFSPISLSCRWEVSRPVGIPTKLSSKLQADIDNAVKIGINVASYATNRELKQKLDAIEIIEPRADIAASMRGTLQLPKLQHSGGADDVPRAIANLLEAMKREIPIPIASKSLMVAPIEKDLAKYPLVYIHGRQKFAWTAEQRKSLRTFFDHGGFLIGDAICGSPEFANSLRDELKQILPEATLQKVGPDHPMLTQEYGGFDVRRVTFVDPKTGSQGGLIKRVGPPVLELLLREQRAVAIFSPWDLSCALESRAATQCRGYTSQDAAKLGINMILYSLLQPGVESKR